MLTRPSNNQFFEWVQNDQNKSKVQNALIAHPDLINIKDSVSFNLKYFLILILKYCFSLKQKWIHMWLVPIVIMKYLNSPNISDNSSNYHIL